MTYEILTAAATCQLCDRQLPPGTKVTMADGWVYCGLKCQLQCEQLANDTPQGYTMPGTGAKYEEVRVWLPVLDRTTYENVVGWPPEWDKYVSMNARNLLRVLSWGGLPQGLVSKMYKNVLAHKAIDTAQLTAWIEESL